MKNVYFKEIKMTEREALIYIHGFLKGINYDPDLIGRVQLMEFNTIIVEALDGVNDEN
jgi:hypothetical protein